MKRALLPSVLVCVAAAISLSAQSARIPPMSGAHTPPSLALIKGQIYTLKVPSALLTSGGVRAGWSTVSSVLLVEIRGSQSGIQIGGQSNWKSSGFPSMLQVKFEKVNVKKDFTDVEFRPVDRTDSDVNLRFQPGFDYRTAVGELMIPGPSSSVAARAYLDEAYGVLSEKFFAGPLASVPAEKKRLLVTYAHVTANGTSLTSETYKNNLYMVVDLGRDTSVYNDLRFSQSTLLAHVMNEKLLVILKAFAKPVEDAPQLHGLKLEYEIPHKSLLDEGSSAAIYVLEFYAPADLIRKFADADITNQQFVDGSIAIVNENRVQVSLAATSGQ